MVRPRFRHQRYPAAPFATHGEAGHEAQCREQPETGCQRGQTGEQRIEEYRINHHPLTADVISEDSTNYATDAPAEQRHAYRDARPECAIRVLFGR